MFHDATFLSLLVAALLVGVALLFWWADFDGIRSAWEYHRRCRKRERMCGDEFFRSFYQTSGIPAELVIGFRQFHAEYWGENPELLRPEDDLFQVNAGADCADWFAGVQASFGVTVSEQGDREVQNASFDSVLRYIHRLRNQTTSPGGQTGGFTG